MSGGHFNYAQYRIADIRYEIEDYLDGHPLDGCDVESYIKDHWLDDDGKEYIRKHHHTIPNQYEFSGETLYEMHKCVELLKKAEVYVQRIDWLLSGDDSEETFLRRLRAVLKDLHDNNKQ